MPNPVGSIDLLPLISARRIARRVEQMGLELSKHFAGKDPLVLVVMDGASYFATDLTRAIQLPPLRIHFISASSYHGGTKSSGSVQLSKLPNCKDEDILLIDDILDTGHTLTAIEQNLSALGAQSIFSCILLDKPGGREVPYQPNLVGFTVPNAFLVGYGLDYMDRMRHLPDICIASP